MPKDRVKVFVCFEPDQALCAEQLVAWQQMNSNLARYNARITLEPDSEEAKPIKRQLREQIIAADVTICLIGQTTFLSDWISWELDTSKARPNPNGLVGIKLHEFDAPPEAMLNSGTIFVPFRRDAIAEAVDWAAQNRGGVEDFLLEE